MTDQTFSQETRTTPISRQKTKPETAPIACHRRKGMYISTCRSARQEKEKGVFQSHGSLVSGWSPYEPQQAINEVYDSVCEGKSTSFRTHFLTNSRIYFCRFEKLRTFRKSLSTNSPNRSSFLFFLSTSRFSSPTASRAYTHTPPHTHSANFRFFPSPFTSRITY